MWFLICVMLFYFLAHKLHVFILTYMVYLNVVSHSSAALLPFCTKAAYPYYACEYMAYGVAHHSYASLLFFCTQAACPWHKSCMYLLFMLVNSGLAFSFMTTNIALKFFIPYGVSKCGFSNFCC